MNNSTQQEGRLRFVKATERLPTETNLFNIKYGVAPKLGWYNNEAKQFYGDVLEKYPLNNNAVQWLEELPSSQPVSVEPDGMKAKFAAHLGLKPGEELNTTDAYAVEWAIKNLNGKL